MKFQLLISAGLQKSMHRNIIKNKFTEHSKDKYLLTNGERTKQMIIKCSNCSGALTYDIITGKMLCKHCGSTFLVDEFEDETNKESALECNVYTCTSCAAELMVNNREASTYCAYCGQPTIVFDHIDKMERPKKIIPFSVTRGDAIQSVRDRFSRGFFIPEELKNFEVERMTGIYVPFWLYSIKYYDKQKLLGKSGKQTNTYYREAETSFVNLTIDASANFANYSSQQLEPYNMYELKDFHPGYLSGFYADKYDQNSEVLSELAIVRCKKLFDEEVKKSINASSITIKESNPLSTLLSQTYAMLPAWFLTIRYKDEPYTILINGQTGKLTGAVPMKKQKIILVFIIIFILLALILVPLFYSIFSGNYDSDSSDNLVELIAAVLIITYGTGMKLLKSYKKHMRFTSSRQTEHYAGNRQKGE